MFFFLLEFWVRKTSLKLNELLSNDHFLMRNERSGGTCRRKPPLRMCAACYYSPRSLLSPESSVIVDASARRGEMGDRRDTADESGISQT